MKSPIENDEKKIHLNETRHEIMMMDPGTTPYDMNWWRRCVNGNRVIYGSFYQEYYEKQSNYMPV